MQSNELNGETTPHVEEGCAQNSGDAQGISLRRDRRRGLPELLGLVPHGEMMLPADIISDELARSHAGLNRLSLVSFRLFPLYSFSCYRRDYSKLDDTEQA